MKLNSRLMLPASLILLGGCASAPVDYSALESKVGQAKSGDFGTCYTNIHSAASALEEAEAHLARIKAFPDFTSKSTVDAAVAKVNMALADKAAADEACNARTAVLEKDMVGVKKTLANHEMRLKELEKVREIIRGVTFQTGSAKLTTQAQAVLDVVANRLQRSPIPVQIAGHASSTGTPQMNMKLSQARAESVMRFLISRGVDAKLLTAKGYGISQPIASNDTADGRRANQRVELRFRE